MLIENIARGVVINGCIDCKDKQSFLSQSVSINLVKLELIILSVTLVTGLLIGRATSSINISVCSTPMLNILAFSQLIIQPLILVYKQYTVKQHDYAFD